MIELKLVAHDRLYDILPLALKVGSMAMVESYQGKPVREARVRESWGLPLNRLTEPAIATQLAVDGVAVHPHQSPNGITTYDDPRNPPGLIVRGTVLRGKQAQLRRRGNE